MNTLSLGSADVFFSNFSCAVVTANPATTIVASAFEYSKIIILLFGNQMITIYYYDFYHLRWTLVVRGSTRLNDRRFNDLCNAVLLI